MEHQKKSVFGKTRLKLKKMKKNCFYLKVMLIFKANLQRILYGDSAVQERYGGEEEYLLSGLPHWGAPEGEKNEKKCIKVFYWVIIYFFNDLICYYKKLKF